MEKVNLTLLKRLVAELETTLALAEQKTSEDYVVELSKAIGIASGAALEATMLVTDIQTLVRASGAPVAKDAGLGELMSLFKTGKVDGRN